MSLLNNILHCIINGDANYCCLCFNAENYNAFQDELFIETAEDKRYITLSDIIISVLGNEIQEYVSTFNNIMCEDCANTLVTMYTFIQNTKYYAKCFTNTLDWLNNNIQEVQEDNKTLFIEINLKDQSIKQIYDSETVKSKSDALERYQFLKAPKIKEVKIKTEDDVKKLKKKAVKVSEMLCDPNNINLYKCKVCCKIYRTMWSLKNHYIRAHAPQAYKCTKCPRSFGSQAILDLHLDDSHCEVICSECGKSFNSRSSLIKHELRHNAKDFVCHDCGRTYKSSLSFKNHVKTKCREKCMARPSNPQFTCDYCNKKYTQKISLRVHIQHEHGNYKSHICEWCGKKFWAQSRLKAHVVKHTGEKNFPCTTCKRNFVTKESLLYHTRLHTGEKPYRCSECGCGFISASRKMYHMKTYHQAAICECDICHSKFSSPAYLQKHKKSHGLEKEDNSKSKMVKLEQKKKIKKCSVKTSDSDIEGYSINAEVSRLLDDNFNSEIYHEPIGTMEGLFSKMIDL